MFRFSKRILIFGQLKTNVIQILLVGLGLFSAIEQSKSQPVCKDWYTADQHFDIKAQEKLKYRSISQDLTKSNFKKNGFAVVSLADLFTSQEIQNLYAKSKSVGSNDLDFRNSDSILSTLEQSTANKILKIGNLISNYLNRIDRPELMQKGQSFFKNSSISLSDVFIRNETGRQVQNDYALKGSSKDGHIHSTGWVTATLALLGPGSWYEVNGVRYQTSTHDLLIFTDEPRSKNGPEVPATYHGTPRLDGSPRLLILMGFEYQLDSNRTNFGEK